MNLLELARKPVTLRESALVSDAARRMAAEKVGSVEIVSDQGTLLGVFTERDLMTKVVARDLPPRRTPLSQVMTRPIATLAPNGSLKDAIQTMLLHQIRHIPVVDKDRRVLGVLSFREVLAEQVQDLDRELDSLETRTGSDAPGG